MRPYVFTIGLLLLAGMGWINGFVTARVLKFFGSVDWCFSAFIAAIVFPIYLILTLAFIDFIEWAENAGYTVTIPFSSAFFYTAIWLAICIPLCFHGAYTGFKINQAKKVCKVNPVRRNIPQQPYFMSS